MGRNDEGIGRYSANGSSVRSSANRLMWKGIGSSWQHTDEAGRYTCRSNGTTLGSHPPPCQSVNQDRSKRESLTAVRTWTFIPGTPSLRAFILNVHSVRGHGGVSVLCGLHGNGGGSEGRVRR